MDNYATGLKAIFIRECRRMVSRPVYLVGIIGIPLFCCFFFTTLLWQGVPERLPIAVIDNDRSVVSRALIRTLNSMSAVNVDKDLESFSQARIAMQKGEIYAYMVIPEGFEADASSGRQPELGFFSNDTYYTAGLFSYKALKITGSLANLKVTSAMLNAKGENKQAINATLQPVVAGTFPLGNPWVSYSVYINNPALPVLLELMIFLMTVFALGIEIKENTSRRLLILGRRSMLRVLLGKLLPQTILFTLVGWFILFYLYAFLRFPLQGSIFSMMAAMLLMVVASQAIGVFFISLLSTLRLSLSASSLFGILAFSLVGFSMPLTTLYGPFHYMSYIYPARHYFMIYSVHALNGFSIWYSLGHYMILVGFMLLPLPLIGRLKLSYYKQVYEL